MRINKIFVLFLFSVFLLYGCGIRATHQVGTWETGKVVNLQFADKVVVVHTHNFSEYLRHEFGYKLPFDDIKIEGEASTCLIVGLKGILPGYAIINDSEINNVNPNAKVVDISVKELIFKKNFSHTGYIAKMKLEVKNGDKVEEISASGNAPLFRTAMEKACEEAGQKIAELIEKRKSSM
ncbi:hypothetical protein V4D30_00840 [Thermodesulfovibrio sp. 3907-1M]|uniref:Lipoprotein n=1 Tax=Thermodesulfovibrio autotrophicus TaxID=3118333 RepID=A0AAU8GX94_9BACT